jgi:hypothetical protein
MEEKKTYRMMHFTPGKEVYYGSFWYKIGYVSVRGHELWVQLENHNTKVLSTELYCEPTEFLLERK